MRAFFIEKNNFLLLLGGMVIVSATLVYLFTAGNSDLWKQTVKRELDTFALKLGKPIFISEIGYRNSADALQPRLKKRTLR